MCYINNESKCPQEVEDSHDWHTGEAKMKHWVNESEYSKVFINYLINCKGKEMRTKHFFGPSLSFI
jgi:hypothetical protein